MSIHNVTFGQDGLTGDGNAGTNVAKLTKLLTTLSVAAPPGTGGKLWPSPGEVLLFPSPKGISGLIDWGTYDLTYAFDGSVNLPSNMSLTIRGTGTHAVALSAVQPGTPIFVIDKPGPRTRVVFERLTFVGGGVQLRGPIEGGVVFRDCNFRSIPGWCVESTEAGFGADHVVFTGCNLTECGSDGTGMIRMRAADYDWSIDHCVFAKCMGTMVRAGGRRLRIAHSNLEQGLGDNRGDATDRWLRRKPFVHVDGPGEVRVLDVRFGNETLGNPPPPYIVVIGPLDLPECDASAVRDVHFDGCAFAGSAADASLPPRAAIRLTAAVSGLRVTSCSAWQYRNLIVDDGATMTPELVGAYGTPGSIADEQNALHFHIRGDTPVDRVFVKSGLDGEVRRSGGRGMAVLGRRERQDLLRVTADARRGGNLLTSTDPSTGDTTWQASPAAAVSSAANVSPPGAAGAMWNVWKVWSITRKSSGSVWVAQDVELVPRPVGPRRYGQRPLVFSVWMRTKSAQVEVALEIRLYGEDAGASALERVLVRDAWARYSVVSEWAGANPVVSVALQYAPGFLSALGSEPVLLAAGAQLEPGSSPSPFTPEVTWDSEDGGLETPIRTTRQTGALVLGPTVIGYGTAAPKDGYHNVGDRIINSSPAASSPRGWICVEGWSFDPATKSATAPVWRRFGVIEP